MQSYKGLAWSQISLVHTEETTHIFVCAVRREHGLLGVVEAGVVRVVALYAPLHKLLPVSTKHPACHLRKQETLAVTIRIKPAAALRQTLWMKRLSSACMWSKKGLHLHTPVQPQTGIMIRLQPWKQRR